MVYAGVFLTLYTLHRRLELLDLGERKACTFSDLFQHEFPVGEQSPRRREHILALAFELAFALTTRLATCLTTRRDSFYCFSHSVPPFF